MQPSFEETSTGSSATGSAGDPSYTIEQAIANLQGDDLGLRVYSAWWLGRFRVKSPEAVNALILALDDEADRTKAGGYPLRRNAARALGKLGDRRAVPGLINSLSCTDFYVREAAAQSLEMLGATDSIPILVQLLNNEIPGTLPAPEKPDFVQPYDAILEALGSLGATHSIPIIKPFLDHSIGRVKYAAARALYQLTPDVNEAKYYGDLLIEGLSGQDLQLRRAILADLGAIGYFPAADAIATAPAENSLKLIALKGILEAQLSEPTAEPLSEQAVHVLSLMDDLL